MTTENKLDELKAKAADAKVQGEKALDDLKENVKEKQTVRWARCRNEHTCLKFVSGHFSVNMTLFYFKN